MHEESFENKSDTDKPKAIVRKMLRKNERFPFPKQPQDNPGPPILDLPRLA
jgi:hypothetical protein